MRLTTLILLAALILGACSESSTERDASASDDSASSEPASRSASDPEACGADAAEKERLLEMTPAEFDQDMVGGWRVVADKPGCELIAASLIEAYINKNDIEPAEGVMHWHVGQLFALGGDSEAAISWLEAAATPGNLAWNLYVDGTVAFLRQDRPALETARDALAGVEVSEAEKASRRQFLSDNPDIVVSDRFVDEPQNLSVLEGFVACFNQPYSVAYGCAP